MAAAATNWVPTGDGLQLKTARAVASAHGVPLDVVLKGWYVHAVDGPDGFPDLHGVEDHIIVTNQADGRHLIKFANYAAFEDACEAATAPGQQQHDDDARLTVVVMPYADLESCEKLQDLEACPDFGYDKIDIANRDILLWKKRDMATLDAEADKCRQLTTQMEKVMDGFIPANMNMCRSLEPGCRDRRIAKERLLKAHLDVNRYGDAHELLLLLDKGKHDAIFGAAGCYDPCRPGDNASGDHAPQKLATVHRLEVYKQELDERYGAFQLDPYPERSNILKMEARYKLRREIADARREVQDIVETATQELERIAEQLDAMANEHRLLGCGI